jgi:hypothetical protein
VVDTVSNLRNQRLLDENDTVINPSTQDKQVESKDILIEIYNQLKIMNTHMEIITDNKIEEKDIL